MFFIIQIDVETFHLPGITFYDSCIGARCVLLSALQYYCTGVLE